jgi:predicted DNA-binding WGR domain protein
MLKLYRLSDSKKEYWETWEVSKTSHMVHWGELGAKGESKTIKAKSSAELAAAIQQEINTQIADGFVEIDAEDHAILLIEYAIDEMGSTLDLEKRHRLQDRMNETLGWLGLGACDGGSIGMGTMEACCFVVDFELAKQVVAKDLAGTEFENFTRIYDERAK